MVSAAPSVGSPATDLRIAFALRPHVRAYRVAARVGIHPALLSRALNGYRVIDSALAARIHEAILAEEAQLAEGGR